MKARIVWLIMALGALAAVARPMPAEAEERAMPLRSFDRFELDPKTARGLWAEAATALAREEEDGSSLEVITVAPRLVCGWRHLELGVLIPYHFVNVEVSVPSGPVFRLDGRREEDGIGDIQLYGKGVLRTELVDGALGLDLSLPSGDEGKGLGAGEVGFLPFGAVGVPVGPAEVRAHVGYRAFVDSDDDHFFDQDPLDFLLYGFGLFVPFSDHLAGRVEFLGAASDEPHVVTFEPGLDVRIPLGPADLLLRPTGAVGITGDAPDWGVGGSVALAWDPAGTP